MMEIATYAATAAMQRARAKYAATIELHGVTYGLVFVVSESPNKVTITSCCKVMRLEDGSQVARWRDETLVRARCRIRPLRGHRCEGGR